jgi:hypothetical protein
MLIDFIAFLCKLGLGLLVFKLAEVKLIERNPESSIGGALAFLVG